MKILVNLFCVLLSFHLSRGTSDTGMKRELKNFVGNSVVYISTKSVEPYLSKNQALSIDESNDVTDGKQQEDANVIYKSKLSKRIKDYPNLNNDKYNDRNSNSRPYYRRNSFLNPVGKYAKNDISNNTNNNNIDSDKYLNENLKSSKEVAVAKIKQNDKFSSSVCNNENDTSKTLENNYINAYKSRNTSGNKKLINNNKHKIPSSNNILHQSDTLNHLTNDKNSNPNQHATVTNMSSVDFFNPYYMNSRPLAHEFSLFVNKIFKLNPFMNPLLMPSDINTFNSNRVHNYSERNKLFAEDNKIQRVKNQIGDRIKHHRPLFTGNLNELNHLEEKLNNPVLQEDSLIDNVVSIQNFISNIIKNSPENLLRNNFDSDTNADLDLFHNRDSGKPLPLKFNNNTYGKDNFLTNNLKSDAESYTDSINLSDVDESKYSSLKNKFDEKKFPNLFSIDNDFNDKKEYLKQLTKMSSDLDETVNQSSLNARMYPKNKKYLSSFLSHLSNDRFDKINQNGSVNKLNELSQMTINRNDDFYYPGISNSFDVNHLNLVPSSVLIKSLNKRNVSRSAPESVWYSRDFENDFERAKEKYNSKNKKNKKTRLKGSATDKSTINENLINKFDADDSDIDKLCRTYNPKKRPTTTTNEPADDTESCMAEEETSSCESSTNEPSSSEVITRKTTSEATEASTACETPIAGETTLASEITSACETTSARETTQACESTKITTSCEPSTDGAPAKSAASSCEEEEEEDQCTMCSCSGDATDEAAPASNSASTCGPPKSASTTKPTKSTSESTTASCEPEETSAEETMCQETTCKIKPRKKTKKCECVNDTSETRCDDVAEMEGNESDSMMKSKTTEIYDSENNDDSEDLNNNDQNLEINNLGNSDDTEGTDNRLIEI